MRRRARVPVTDDGTCGSVELGEAGHARRDDVGSSKRATVLPG